MPSTEQKRAAARDAKAHGKKPSDLHVKVMNVSLILYAEHEFNASTFASRVVAGTGSDMYSAIAGGIGALRRSP